MGLDMYFYKKSSKGNKKKIGYLRKANQIHGFLVNKIQNGNDDCNQYKISLTIIEELKTLCEKSIKERVPYLAPTIGFFFGSDEIDDYYYDDLKEMLKILNEINHNIGDQYFYRSSW